MTKPKTCPTCGGRGTLPGDPAHCDAPICGTCNGAGELYDPNGPRPYTPEEQRAMFLQHFKNMARYWASPNLPCQNTLLERLEGFAFSVLVALDGCAGDLPAFDVVPCPHDTDKEYHIENGENWWVPVPLPGMLHDEFHAEERKARETAQKAQDNAAAKVGADSIREEEDINILSKLAEIAGKKGDLDT